MIPLLQTNLPPSNLSFLIAAFAVTGVVFLGYVLFIFLRRKDTRDEIDRLQASSRRDESGGTEEP